MDQKTLFVADCARGTHSFSALCQRYGVSRRSGYRLLARFSSEGPAGLVERSRRPEHSPGATPARVIAAVLELRPRFGYGPKKLLELARESDPELSWPAPSTVAAILHRHGAARRRRRRRPLGHPGRPTTVATEPNAIWTADFKGHFKTLNGVYCYPLTILDDYSRFLLRCQGLLAPTQVAARRVFERLFREYGLPAIIRTDNGVPFASCAGGRLYALGVVDPARDLPRAHPARPSGTERPP